MILRPGRAGTAARRAAGAALLSVLVVLVSVLVLVRELGTRPGIRYVNGAKLFLSSGPMWYHTPGLEPLGLAPQGFGGAAHLRHHDQLLSTLRWARLHAVELDLDLEAGAVASLALDQRGEGTYTGLRLSALDSGALDTAWVRFVDGVQVEHRSLDGVPRTLAPGPHRLRLEGAPGGAALRLDGIEVPLPMALSDLRPAPAIGAGEREVAVRRWRLEGEVDADGARRPVQWEEGWTLSTAVRGRGVELLVGVLALWTGLIGAPWALASAVGRAPLAELGLRAFVRPRARLVYGLACLCPWTPLWLQAALLLNWLLMVWGALLSAAAAPQDTVVPGPRWARGAAGLGLAVVGAAVAALLAAGPATGPAARSPAGVALGALAPAPLQLGLPRLLPLHRRPEDAEGLAVDLSLDLQPGEALRVDLLRDLPSAAEVFLVDRVNLSPAAPGPCGDSPCDHQQYIYEGVSVLISADPDLPSEILRLGAFHAVRGGRRFSVPPGRRRLTLRLALPALELHVDDELRGWRQDLGLAFPASTAPGESRWARAPVHAVVVQAVSPEVREVGLTAFSDAPISRARPAGAAIAALVAVLAGAGGLGALVHPGTGRARALLPALGPAAALVGALVPGGVPGLPSAAALLLGGAGAGAMGSALAQRRSGRGLAAALGLALVQGALLVELGSMAMPEWRHAARARWDEGLGPSARWYHDPMLRRLNPWFLDSRFQRRAWPADPPAGVARVVVFGGSQTYGWGIPAVERSTFSDRLGEGLRARGHAVEVLNAAFPGVKSTTGLRWFEGNLRRYRPDVVVLNFVVNEFMDVDPHRAWAGPPGPRPLLTVGGLLRALPGRLRASHGLQVVLAREYGVREMEQSLRAFIGAARGAGARPLLCVEPTTLLVETDGREIMAGDAGAGEAMRVHRRLGAELGVPVHEPLNDLRRHAADELFYDTMHLSKRGHAVVAEGLVGAVEPLLPAAARGLVRDSP